MHREEVREFGACLDCGTETSPAAGRSYAFGSSGVLCWECALRRGGSYDAERDDWSVAPQVGDLEREVFDPR
jgi:hypothetical protein